MSDDLLDRATRALRETSREPNLRSGLTRARLLESAERQSRARRGRGLRFFLASAGLLVAGTALARVADQLPALFEAIVRPSSVTAPERPAPKPEKKRPQRAAQPPQAADPATAEPEIAPVPAAETPATLPAPAPEVARPRAPQRAPRPRAGATAVPAPAPALAPEAKAETPAPEPAELALFRRAQRLHFARDPQALAAWDAYLRVAERGALVPEARYNRALSLLRLGRKAEARDALWPFARGDYGAYRSAEAQRLIDALGK